MRHERVLYTRSAKARLRALPLEVRVHLETHVSNLALLLEAMPPERLTQLLKRTEEGFVTAVPEARVLFTVAPGARTLLVHRIEELSESRGDYSHVEREA